MDWERIGKVTLIAAAIGALIVVRAACTAGERRVEIRHEKPSAAEIRENRAFEAIERYFEVEPVALPEKTRIKLVFAAKGYKLLPIALAMNDIETRATVREMAGEKVETYRVRSGEYTASAESPDGEWVEIYVPAKRELYWVPASSVRYIEDESVRGD